MRLVIDYKELRKIVEKYAISKTIGLEVTRCEYVCVREMVDGKERTVPIFKVELIEE